METLSCHSNQSAWATVIKNNSFVEANVMNMYAKFQLHSPYDFWGEDFFENLPFMLTWQPIKFSDLDKFIWIVEDYSRNISVKKNLTICSETAKTANFRFPHLKSMKTISCLSDWNKKLLFIPPTYRCYVWNMARIGFMASEMSFEHVDAWRRRTDDGYLPIL